MNPGFNPPIGQKPELEWLAVGGLRVDPTYQRSTENETSKTLIRKVARFWDWSLCQPLAVTRRADGSLFVVDGQHRLAAAKLRGDIDELPCVVTRYASLSDEAAAFVSINQQRRPLGKVDLFKAALAAGDTDAAAIHRLIAMANLSIAPHGTSVAWKPGMLFCVPGIQRAYRSIGRPATSLALEMLSAAFHGQVLQFAGQLLEGLFEVAAGVGAAPGFDRTAMVRALTQRAQPDWVKLATRRRLETGVNRRTAMRDVMIEAYGARPFKLAERPPAPALAAPALAEPRPSAAPKPFAQRFRNFEDQLAAAKQHGIVERPVLRRDDDVHFGVVGEINL